MTTHDDDMIGPRHIGDVSISLLLRPSWAKLVASLKPGVVVVVTRLDRLAWSTIDLLMILQRYCA